MNTPLKLADTAVRLNRLDLLLMSLVKRRMDLAREVERSKAREKDPKKRKIFNKKREIGRLKDMRKWAKKHGLNPYFAESVLYMLIGESCKQQMIQSQNNVEKVTNDSDDEKAWRKTLDRNLLTLTKAWSETYDVGYTEAFFATRSYLQFENELLKEEISRLPDRDVFLDIGCATGRLTFQFASQFERVIGYDISSHMVAKANARTVKEKVTQSCFKVADVQKGIPEPNNSVSLAVMNLGTASDIRELPKVLKEIHRVLKPHGRFFLSFYNKEALLYRWDFIPWPTGLAAEINTVKYCLDVHLCDKVLSVFAKPYSVDEVQELVKGGITIAEVQTYPTVSAILPNDLFENQPDVQRSFVAMDKDLAVSNGGAYIVASGKKSK